MNKTILIAAMFAVAAILGVGLTVLPSTVQEAQAQANLCSSFTHDIDDIYINCDFEGIGKIIIYDYSNDIDNVPLGELPLPIQ